MTQKLSLLAFSLGALVVAWCGLSFIGSNLLALSVTAAIAAVYTSGFAELLRYQKATATLTAALAAANDSVSELDHWLSHLHPSLHSSVRLRIQSEPVALPQPVMTPYLVGLLVMLGMLGTFVGMVDTLKGAVTALQGSTELSAIRAGLAAPIQGLGMAFGTSVAGVAASAMLGFISTLSRRERMLAARVLDQKTQTVFQAFSLAFKREKAFQAMQNQADTLPAIATRLEQLALQIENRGEQIGQQLLAGQAQFHASARQHYQELAASVGQSLQQTLAQSGKLAADSLQPVLNTLLQDNRELASTLQQQTAAALQQQLAALGQEFSQTTSAVSQAWQQGLDQHNLGTAQLQQHLFEQLETLGSNIKSDSQQLLENLASTATATLAELAHTEQARLHEWLAAINSSQQASATLLEDMASTASRQIQALGNEQAASLSRITAHFDQTSAGWLEQWHKASTASLSQQQAIIETLDQACADISGKHRQTAVTIATDIERLLASSEQLLAARSLQEAGWMDNFNARIDNIGNTLADKLDALHSSEAARAETVRQQLADLQEVARTQLASLGAALEEPMGKLIRLASETPKAAAEVISSLRSEISNNIERDNALLEERRQIMADLQALGAAMTESSAQQKDAITHLVSSASDSLLATSQLFGENISEQLEKMAGAADLFSGSTAELASLGDAFTLAVELFSHSNSAMHDSLAQIQQALQQAASRNDEQLAYYVAQAREIIDYNILSQQEIISQIRQLARHNETAGDPA